MNLVEGDRERAKDGVGFRISGKGVVGPAALYEEPKENSKEELEVVVDVLRLQVGRLDVAKINLEEGGRALVKGAKSARRL